MTAWVYPDHDHVVLAEMTDREWESAIAVHASHHATGESCEQCNAAVRRVAGLLRQLGLAWFSFVPGL